MKTKPRKNSITPAPADGIQAAIDYGIDISSLIQNINRTPADRIKRHQIALNTAEKLRKAKSV